MMPNDDPVITGCDMAVLFTAGSANNTVSYGSLVDNIQGIVFQACAGDMDGEVPDDNRIIGTRIENNWLNGVSFFNGSGNRLENCLISGSETGAAFLGGSGNVLSGCTVTDNQTGVLIGINSSGNVISSGTVENNTADNFLIDGNNNLIENITLSIGNSLGHISGTGNSLSGISITGDGTGIGLIVPGGDVQLNDVIIANFNVGVGFELDAACLSFSGVSTITGCDTCEAGILIDEKYMLKIDLGGTPISSFENGIKDPWRQLQQHHQGRAHYIEQGQWCSREPGNEFPEENRFIGIDVIDNGLNGIALLGGFNNQVIGCTIEDNNSAEAPGGYGGIALMNGSGTIERSRISGNGCAGIHVDEAAGVDIAGNLLFGNREGIRLGFVTGVVISSNTISDNQSGLVIGVGALPQIYANILYGNGMQETAPMTSVSKVPLIPRT